MDLVHLMTSRQVSALPFAKAELLSRVERSIQKTVATCLVLCAVYYVSANNGVEDLIIPGEYRNTQTEYRSPARTPELSYDERFNHELNLERITSEEQEQINELLARQSSSSRVIGIHRQSPVLQDKNLMQLIQWDLIETGWAGTVTVKSPGATSIRLQLQIQTSSPVEIIFFAFDSNGEAFAINRREIQPLHIDSYDELRPTPVITTEQLWSPSSNGSVIGFEVRVPDERARDLTSLVITKLAHRFQSDTVSIPERNEGNSVRTINTAKGLPTDTSACDSQYVACHTGSFSTNASNATALITYEEGGLTGTCTGTLVTDTAPGTQHFFLTAAHCIANQTVASTVEVNWFFQRAACASATIDSRQTKTSGGANLIKRLPSYDTVLIDLKTAPPSGAYYAGLNATTSAWAIGSTLDNLHHVLGEEKRFASGLTREIVNDDVLLITIQSGYLDSGSSGSGWFSGSDLVAVYFGTPIGQSGKCGNDAAVHPLSLTYSDLKNFLEASTATTSPKIGFDRRIYRTSAEKGTINVVVKADRTLASAIDLVYKLSTPTLLARAKRNEDYTIPSSVSLPVGSSNANIPVVIVEDELDEVFGEIFILSLQDTTSYDLTDIHIAYVLIMDDDDPPKSISLAVTPSTIAEGEPATSVTVTATIDGTVRWGQDETPTISVAASGKSNVVGFNKVDDFTLNIPEGASSGSQTFSLTSIDDQIDTGDETISISGKLREITVSPTTLTLTDDDTPPTVLKLSVSPATLSESARPTDITVTATIDGTTRWNADQTVAISVDGSGASNVVGFAAVADFNLTIAKGAASGTAKFSISPTDDNFNTDNETVTIDGQLTGVTVSSAELTLTDDDTVPTEVALSISPSTISEGAGATDATVTATIDGSTRWPNDQTISITVDGSEASNVVGFAEVSDFDLTIVKGTGVGTAKFSITPTDDTLDTGNETVTISGELTGVNVESATLTLIDDDAAPTDITLSLAPSTLSEGAGTTEITVTATVDGSARWASDQTMTVAVDNSGTGNVVGFAAVSDFNLTVAKGAGSGSAKFSITPVNDTIDTGNETVTVSGNLTDVSVNSAKLTLTDDDSAPSEIALSISPTTVSEGAGTTEVSVTATIDGSTRWSTVQTVSISVDDSGASNVVGFAEVSDFDLTIAKGAGSGTAKFSIAPTDDNFDTGNETVSVEGVLTGVTVEPASLTLTDDDTAPAKIKLSIDPTTVSEGAGATDVTVTATIDGASRWSSNQTVAISLAGSGTSDVVGFTEVADFDLTIAKGVGSGTAKFSIAPTDDNFDTGNETVSVEGELTGVTVEPASLTLTDDDTAPSKIKLSIDPTTVSEGAGATDVTVTATIDGASRWSSNQTVAISLAGSGTSDVVGFTEVADFDLTIAKGTGSGTAKFSIAPTDDNFDTGNETVSVEGELTGVTVEPASLTLTDDDTAPSKIKLSIDPTTVSEGAGATDVTVTATIDGASRWSSDQTVAISVAGSGTSDVVGFSRVPDFNLKIAKGSAAGTAKFSIAPTDDNIDTGNETVTVKGELTGVNVSPANLTLTDNDTAPSAISLSLSPTTVSEGAGATDVTVTATIDGASRWSVDQSASISVDGSGTSDVVGFAEVADFELTIAKGTGSGTAKFSIVPTDDKFDTGNETVTVKGELTGVTVSSANMTLTDDDTAPSAISLLLSPTTVSEGAGATDVTITATIDGASRWSSDQTVTVSVDGSGTSNVVGFSSVSDFNLTIAKGAGSGMAKFSITPTEDILDTGNETVTISGKLAGVTVSPVNLVLIDNDGAPSAINLSLSPTTISEGAGTTEVTVTATIDGSSRWSSDQNVTISVNGSGANDVVGFAGISDFDLTIAKGTGSGTAKFSITPTTDNIDTGNETVTVKGDLTGVSVSSAELTLTDDDTAPSKIALSLSPTSVSEGAGPTEVTVTATIDGSSQWSSDQTISISVAGSGSSNVVGFAGISDFDLTIAKGTGSGTAKFSITPTTDNIDTGNETVTVNGDLTGVSVSSAELTLTDDDTAPSKIALSLYPTSVSEGAGTTEVTVTATIDGSTRWSSDQIVTISVNGSGANNVVGFAEVADFDLTIAKGSGSSTAKISIAPTDDNVDTGNETITFDGELTGVTIDSASLTLTDNDTATSTITLSLSPTTVSEGAGATDVTVTATIDGSTRWSTDQIVTISVNGSGADNVVQFAEVAEFELTITKGDGSGTAKFSVTPTDDNLDTGNETITVDGELTGVTVESTNLELTDNDTTPSSITLSLSPTTVSEGASETDITVTATIDGAARWSTNQSIFISVNDSGATNVVKFQPVSSFNLTITRGAGTGTGGFTLAPINDAIITDAESITVAGTLEQVDVRSATLILSNDDLEANIPVISINGESGITEGGTAGYTLNATPIPTSQIEINLSVIEPPNSKLVGPRDLGANTIIMPTSGTASYSVKTLSDSVDEPNAQVTVAIDSGNGYTIGSAAQASVTVVDDDATAITISRTGTASISEAGGTETVSLTLGRNLHGGEVVTVPLAISGTNITSSDYRLSLTADGNLNSGVSSLTTIPHSESQPAVVFTGSDLEHVQTATLLLTAIDDDDNHFSETLQIGFGIGSRTVSSNLDRLAGIGSEGTAAEGSVSIEIIDPQVHQPSDEDQGNNREQAELVDANSVTSSALEEEGDVDYFKFITAERGTIKISTKGDAETICSLENLHGDFIETLDSQDGRCLIESFQEQGAYWVSVKGRSNESIGTYTLHIEVDYEDVSDDPDNPHEMLVNSTFASRLGAAEDADYYSVPIEDDVSGTLQIYTLGITDTEGCRLYDRIELGKDVWHCNDDGGQGRNFSLAIEVTNEHRFLFRVQGHEGASGRYVLVVEFQAEMGDEDDPFVNSAWIESNADNWIFQAPATLRLATTDVYQVDIPRASQFAIHVTGEPDTRIKLLRANEVIDESLSLEDEVDGFKASFDSSLTGGAYYILVKGATETEEGAYRLNLELQPLNSVEVKSVL